MTIYFIQARCEWNPVKIGYTRDKTPKKRLHLIHTMSPVAVKLLGFVIAGSHADEQAAHRELRPHRLHSEWYRSSPEVMIFVEEWLSGKRSPMEIWTSNQPWENQAERKPA